MKDYKSHEYLAEPVGVSNEGGTPCAVLMPVNLIGGNKKRIEGLILRKAWQNFGGGGNHRRRGKTKKVKYFKPDTSGAIVKGFYKAGYISLEERNEILADLKVKKKGKDDHRRSS